MKRRDLIKVLAAGAFPSAWLRTARAQTSQQSLSGATLRVGTFGGSWKDAVHRQVGEKLESLGVKVEYVIGNPAENFSKIIAARGRSSAPIDVMELGPAEHIVMLREDLLEDIPLSSISNASKLPAHLVDQKALPHLMIQNGIVFREDIFAQEALPTLSTYGGLVNPSFKNRVAFPDVTNTQHWTAVTALAYEAGGNETTPEKGFELVRQMDPLYYFSAASELAQKFVSGDVIAAPWHTGWAVRLFNSGEKVNFVHPMVNGKRGAIEYNYFGIVKGSKNVQAAAAFLDLFLETTAQTEFARATGIVPINREARENLASDAVLSKFMLLDDRDIDEAFTVDWTKIDQEGWRTQWARDIGR